MKAFNLRNATLCACVLWGAAMYSAAAEPPQEEKAKPEPVVHEMVLCYYKTKRADGYPDVPDDKPWRPPIQFANGGLGRDVHCTQLTAEGVLQVLPEVCHRHVVRISETPCMEAP